MSDDITSIEAEAIKRIGWKTMETRHMDTVFQFQAEFAEGGAVNVESWTETVTDVDGAPLDVLIEAAVESALESILSGRGGLFETACLYLVNENGSRTEVARM